MIGNWDPNLNFTSSEVIRNEESIHDLACLVIVLTLSFFITGFFCVVCKIYEEGGRESHVADETTFPYRKKSSIVSKNSRFFKVPNNTPLQSPNELWV